MFAHACAQTQSSHACTLADTHKHACAVEYLHTQEAHMRGYRMQMREGRCRHASSAVVGTCVTPAAPVHAFVCKRRFVAYAYSYTDAGTDTDTLPCMQIVQNASTNAWAHACTNYFTHILHRVHSLHVAYDIRPRARCAIVKRIARARTRDHTHTHGSKKAQTRSHSIT